MKIALADEIDRVEKMEHVLGADEGAEDVLATRHGPALTAARKGAAVALDKRVCVRGESAARVVDCKEGANRTRRGLHAALVQRAADQGLPKNWPDRFFREDHERHGRTEQNAPVAGDTAIDGAPRSGA